MREVDQHAELVAGAHERTTRVGEPGTGVRSAGIAERHAVPERVVPAPDDSERAQPALDPFIEVRELWVDRLRTLEMEDRADRIAGDAAL